MNYDWSINTSIYMHIISQNGFSIPSIHDITFPLRRAHSLETVTFCPPYRDVPFCELKLESLKIAECSSLFRRCAVPFPRGRIPFRNSVTLLHIFLHGARVGIAREIWGGEGCECNVSYRCALTRDARACGTIGPWESVRASRVRCELSISANIVAPIEIKPSARYEIRQA